MFVDNERNSLHEINLRDKESEYLAKIILLQNQGYNSVPEIRTTTHRDINIRKWINRFNEIGIDDILSKIHKNKTIKITDDVEKTF